MVHNNEVHHLKCEASMLPMFFWYLIFGVGLGGGVQGKTPDSDRFWIFGDIGILVCLKNEKGAEEGAL